MRQYEAVIKVMEENGGFATLGHLYSEALKVEGCDWKTQTPFASIRRIVQDKRFFFKIKPGLWALKAYKVKLPANILPTKETSEEKKSELNHSYYQGLLVEIGSIRNFQTFVPAQDKNKIYLGKRLWDKTSIKEFYNFSYEQIIKKARTIDVSWFNSRNMPKAFFEVEHSTDFNNSLIKFTELQDFNSSFYIVADKARSKEYESKISSSAFSSIKGRVKFMSYENISQWHSKSFELHDFEKNL